MAPRKSSISKEEYEFLAEFRWSLRQFLRFSEAAARTAGLTAQQHQALLAIKGFRGRDPITVGDLAERLLIAHHSAVGLINRLAARRYVKRLSGKRDRRVVYVELPAEGEDLLERLSAAHRDQLRRIGPRFLRLLDRLR